MTRLQLEQQRLYGPDARLVDAQGCVRAAVLELGRPADWSALSAVWQGVQTELDLPAPAIAVNGVDGHQLWFSLAEPVPVALAWAFVDALRQRFLPHLPARRLALLPAPAASGDHLPQHARPVPAALTAQGPWSAFVAPDLAAVFSDEPQLDMPPNPDGQAKLLAGLASTPLADLHRAMAQLQMPVQTPALRQPPLASSHASNPEAIPANQPAAPPAPSAAPAPAPAPSPAHAPENAQAEAQAPDAGPPADWSAPHRFLLDTMNDPSAPLGLRIEAAKALLPYAESRLADKGRG